MAALVELGSGVWPDYLNDFMATPEEKEIFEKLIEAKTAFDATFQDYVVTVNAVRAVESSFNSDHLHNSRELLRSAYARRLQAEALKDAASLRSQRIGYSFRAILSGERQLLWRAACLAAYAERRITVGQENSEQMKNNWPGFNYLPYLLRFTEDDEEENSDVDEFED